MIIHTYRNPFLKGQTFNTFWGSKLQLGPIQTDKNGCAKFFFAKVREKNVCLHVSLVNDYTDTVLGESTTTPTLDKLFYFGKRNK